MTRIIGTLPPKLNHFRTAWDNVFDWNGTEEQEPQNTFMYKKSGRNESNPESKLGCFKC